MTGRHMADVRPEPIVLPVWLFVPGAVVFAVSLISFLLLTRVIGLGGYDLTIYFLGGHAFELGLPVYEQQLHSPFGIGYFTYPPVSLLLFGPLSGVPQPVAHAIIVAAGILALWGAIWLSARMFGCQRGLGLLGASLGAAGAALWLEPVYDTLDQGQINLILMLLVVADFALDSSRRWPTGILIGVAAAVKITPGIFIVYLLLRRRYRAALSAIGVWAALTVLGFIVARADSIQYWFSGMFADSDRVTSPLTVDAVLNQSIYGVLMRFIGNGSGEIVAYLLMLLVVVSGLAVAVKAGRLLGSGVGMLACAVSGLLISPLTWVHHWVWIVPILVWLTVVAIQISRTSPILAGAIPSVAGLVFLTLPQPVGLPGNLRPGSGLAYLQQAWSAGNHNVLVAVASTAYVSFGLLLLIALGRALRYLRPTGEGDGPYMGLPIEPSLRAMNTMLATQHGHQPFRSLRRSSVPP